MKFSNSSAIYPLTDKVSMGFCNKACKSCRLIWEAQNKVTPTIKKVTKKAQQIPVLFPDWVLWFGTGI